MWIIISISKVNRFERFKKRVFFWYDSKYELFVFEFFNESLYLSCFFFDSIERFFKNFFKG